MLINWRTVAAFQFARQCPQQQVVVVSVTVTTSVAAFRVSAMCFDFSNCDFWVCLPCEIRRNNATGSGGGVWTLSKRNKKNSAIRSTVTIYPFSTVPRETGTVIAQQRQRRRRQRQQLKQQHFQGCNYKWSCASVCACVCESLHVFVFAFDLNYCRSPPSRERARKRRNCKKINDFLPIVTAKRNRRITKNSINCNKTKHETNKWTIQ